MKISSLLISVGAITLATPAAAQVVNFDTITTGATVDYYYDGGPDSLGEIGPNYGIVFEPGDWVTTTAFGETSPPNLAYSASGLGTVDFLNGITTGLNFSYGGFTDTTMSIFSGLDGTGTLLGSFLLPENNPYDFSFIVLPFSGVAESVTIDGGEAQFGWDDITFGSLTRAAVPEPATWAMMLVGLGAIGFSARRRQRVSVSYA